MKKLIKSKRMISVVLSIILIVSMTACTTAVPTIEPRTEEEKVSLEQEIRGKALELLNYSDNMLGFRMAGTEADNQAADYLMKEMQEIGLKNVTKEEIILDSWKLGDATLTINCDCTEQGVLEIRTVGAYPTNINFINTVVNIVDLGKGEENSYNGKEVKDKIVLIETTANLQENINRAKEKGTKGVILGSDLSTYLRTDIENSKELNKDFPVMTVSTNTVNILRKYAVNSEIQGVLTLNSEVKENVPSYVVYGEIEGRPQGDVIYVTANRDSIYKGFMDSGVSVAELLKIAQEMVNEKVGFRNTIRFVITTGQEWGKIGKGSNEGIKALLDKKPEWIKEAKAVIVLDGSLPIMNNTSIATQGTKEILTFLGEYNNSYKKNNANTFINVISEINEERVTEANEWNKRGVYTILQAEPLFSDYLSIEGTSSDVASLPINKEQLIFLIDYYKGLIQAVDTTGRLDK